MKRTLLIMLAFVATALTVSAQLSDLTTMADAVYVKSANIPVGSQQTLSVCMKNSIEVQTLQFDLYLPDGLTLVANEDDELITASKERVAKFNYFQSAVQADGALRLLAQATTANIAVGDGEIATVTVNVSSDMALGDYAVTVKNIILVSRENEDKKVASVSTAITVTEPADTRVVLDETSTILPEAQTNVDVRVKRTIYADEWSTICLPFAMTGGQVKAAFGDDVQLADFSGYDTDVDADDNIVGITVNFKDVSADDGIEANHPYIIKVTEAVTEFDVDGVTIDPDEEGAYTQFDNGKTGRQQQIYGWFVGTYHAGTVVPANDLFISGNQFWYSTGQTQMKAFRAFFEFQDVLTEMDGANASRLRLMVSTSDTTTGVDNVQCSINNVQVYDLQGRAVSMPAKGIYVREGKKIIIK